MIIDAHTHLPSEGWPGTPTPFATVANAVAYLHATGTDAALFTTWQGVLAETVDDLNQGNAAALALAAQYPDFLYPGACLHPAFSASSRYWLQQFRDAGYRWVGELVPYQRPYRYTDEVFLELCAECAAHDHVVQLHVHEDIIEVARLFPNMPVVCAHIGDEAFCRMLAPLPNIWLDISGAQGGLVIGALETAYDILGADRLLYGTDFTGYEPRCFQARLACAVPDSEAREKILWRNVAQLLGSVGSRPIGLSENGMKC